MNRTVLAMYARWLSYHNIILIYDRALWEPKTLIVVWADGTVEPLDNVPETFDLFDTKLDGAAAANTAQQSNDPD